MGGVVDFRGVDILIDLRQRREALEKKIKPLVTSRKTDVVIAFRGKRQYLKSPLPKGIIHAVFALQHLYHIEAARRAGDLELAIRAAIGFARADADVQSLELWNVSTVEAAVMEARWRRGVSEGGRVRAERHRKRTPENERLAREIYGQFHRGKVSKSAAICRTLATLAAEHDIDMSRTCLQSILQRPSA